MNINKTCPLTLVHIPGVENALTDIPSHSFRSVKEWECKTDNKLLTLFNQKKSSPQPGIVNSLPFQHGDDYRCDFGTVDEGYYAGRVAATTQNRKTHWGNWTKYVQPLALNPFLQGVRYTTRVCVLTRFVAQFHRGIYGCGKQVQAGTVVSTLTSVRQEIALACRENPTKVKGSKKISHSCNKHMMGGARWTSQQQNNSW